MHSRKQVLYTEPNTIPKYLIVLVQFHWQKEASAAFFSKNQGKGTHVHILPSAMPVDDLTSFCRFILFGLASFWCNTTICKTLCTSCRCYVTSFLMHLHAHVFFRLDAIAQSVIATATWLGGWLSHHGIVSKRLNLSENFFDFLKAISLQFLETPTTLQNSTGNPFSGGVKYTWGGKIGDFRAILDGILLAKVGPMLTKYSLTFPTIAHLSVISSMPLRKKSATGTVLFLFKICLIVCQVCRLLDLYASIFF